MAGRDSGGQGFHRRFWTSRLDALEQLLRARQWLSLHDYFWTSRVNRMERILRKEDARKSSSSKGDDR